jgi:hypothetical protein
MIAALFRVGRAYGRRPGARRAGGDMVGGDAVFFRVTAAPCATRDNSDGENAPFIVVEPGYAVV